MQLGPARKKGLSYQVRGDRIDEGTSRHFPYPSANHSRGLLQQFFAFFTPAHFAQ